MEEQWKIELYKTPQGNSPVREFILGLELKAQSKVRDSIKLLQGFGIRLGLPRKDWPNIEYEHKLTLVIITILL